ncbi:MAG: hypothetical protein GDA46_01855 [Bdellovibrionales bacterium]|nr:hypothetical protein [Bdellovibrionales bacterium]
MKLKILGFLIALSLFSCAPINLENNAEVQFVASRSLKNNNFESEILSVNNENSIITQLEESIEKPEVSVDYSTQLIRKLSNTIYKNSFCSCKNNEDCSRGCSKINGTCKGKKPSDKSTNYCMRHVTGSIMYVIDEYCKKLNQNTSREQCLKDMEMLSQNQSSKFNICRHSFFYPSALCALNLDGENRINTGTIKNRSVRRNCQYYNTVNDELRYFYTNNNEKFPLFVKTPITSPEKLPYGSIVVLQSNNPHGHVEIKTNIKNCEGSDCFCSDFCVSRKGGWKTPFKPVVAFKWNPLFINLLSDL